MWTRSIHPGMETGAADYTLRVELRADSAKDDELVHLGPRLANNLTGRAFDALGDIERAQLRKKEGLSYLLQHLERTQGKPKVDLLGDSFSEFFVKREAYRKHMARR